jgi:hypothetical protein
MNATGDSTSISKCLMAPVSQVLRQAPKNRAQRIVTKAGGNTGVGRDERAWDLRGLLERWCMNPREESLDDTDLGHSRV